MANNEPRNPVKRLKVSETIGFYYNKIIKNNSNFLYFAERKKEKKVIKL